MMNFTPPKTDVEETEEAIPSNENLMISDYGLVNLVRTHFERAKAVRQLVDNRLLKCVYAFKGQYEPSKLMEIKSDVGGSEAYIPLSNIKIRAGKAWLTDTFFRPNSKMFTLSATPVPNPPPQVMRELQSQLNAEINDLLENASRMSILSQGSFDMTGVRDVIERRRVELKEEFIKKLQDRGKKLSEMEEQHIHDQFVEGGFYTAFSRLLLDIMLYPAAILKGPVLRRQKRFITDNRTVLEVTIPTYNRVSPFDCYPAPYASNFQDGYFIEVLHLPPKDLRSLADVDGFYKDAIIDILGQYDEGGLREWSGITSERNILENKTEMYDDTIDVLEYWGSVQGSLLQEWEIDVADESAYYDICTWLVNDTIIKAMLNPDPLGVKPYNKASFVEIPDSFWGMALSEILDPLQGSVNALARAAINNGVLSSGALIERNKDRINSAVPKRIVPFQMFDVNESALNAAPAYRFYQLTNTSNNVVLLMSHFQKMADEYSGIPAYAHGDVTVGGAGRTASGLSMLQNQASRGIKDVVKNIDDGIIEPMVRKQYYFNLYNYLTDPNEIPDLTIDARGSTNLREKEAESARMLEYLQITSNPVDMQLMGAEGREYLLKGIASNSGLDVEKMFPHSQGAMEELGQMLSPLQAAGGQQLPQIAPNNTAAVPAQAQRLGQGVNQFAKENGR